MTRPPHAAGVQIVHALAPVLAAVLAAAWIAMGPGGAIERPGASSSLVREPVDAPCAASSVASAAAPRTQGPVLRGAVRRFTVLPADLDERVDPWVAGTAAVGPVEARAPEPAVEPPFTGYEHRSRSCRVRVEDGAWEGEDVHSWRAPEDGDGYALLAYDVALLRTQGALPEALASTRAEGLQSEGPDGWMRPLVSQVVAEVGWHRWPKRETLLALDATRGELLVRQDAAGHRRVEALLGELTRGRLGVLPLHVEWLPLSGEQPQVLRVDVPWGTAARAHRGVCAAFLCDYEIEVSMASNEMLPVVGALESGFGVSARRIEEPDGAPALDVEVARTLGVPVFTPFRTRLSEWGWSPELTIEVPLVSAALWRGCLPATAGVHDIRLGDGQRVRLSVGAERRPPVPDAARGRRVLPERVPGAQGPADSGGRVLRVSWSERRGRRSVEVPLRASAGGAVLQGQRVLGWADAPRAPEDPEPAPRPWPVPDGAWLEVRLAPAGPVDVLDLVLHRAEEASEIRRVANPLTPWAEEPTTFHEFPACPVRVDSLRVVLPRGAREVLLD